MTYKKICLILWLCLVFAFAHAQTNTVSVKPAYDAALAQKLGADEYGMKNYIIAFLKRGPTKITDKNEWLTLQKAHLKNIGRLADEGKLVVAGPITDNNLISGKMTINVVRFRATDLDFLMLVGRSAPKRMLFLVNSRKLW